MKALRTKVILSGIVLVFAFIATIGTTFAWFTTSQTVSVESMELQVTAADNLAIIPKDFGTGTTTYSLGGGGVDLELPSTYGTIVTLADLQSANYLPTGASAWRMNPVSVVQSGYTAVDQMTLTEMEDASTRALTSAEANSTTGDYIELEFFLFSQSGTAQDIVLQNLVITAGNNAGDDNQSTEQDNVINAVRLAIQFNDSATFDADNDAVTTTGDNITLPGSTGLGTPYTFGQDGDYSYTFSGDFAQASNNTLAEVSTSIGLSDITPSLPTVNAIDNTTLAGVTLYSIAPTTPTLVTVLVYIEGWDSDTTNDLSEAWFNISFQLAYASAV